MTDNYHLILIPYAGHPQYLGVFDEDIIMGLVKHHIKNDPIDILPSSQLTILPQNNHLWSICMYLVNENINFYVSRDPESGPINYKLWNDQAVLYNKNQILCSQIQGSIGAIHDDNNFKYPWYHGDVILEIPTFIWEKYNLNTFYLS